MLNQKNEDEKYLIYIEIAEAYKPINIDSSFYYLELSEKTAITLNDNASLAKIFNLKGNYIYVKGNYPKAIENYRKAILYSYNSGDSVRVSNLYNNMGVMFRRMGSYDSSLAYYIKSLRLKEITGNKKDAISTINNIGSLYYTQKNYSKSTEYYLKAVKMANALQDTQILAATYNNLGLIHSEQKHYDEALKYFQNAYKIWSEKQDMSGIASTLNNKARVYEAQNKLDIALKYYEEAANIYSKIGDVLNVSNSLSNAANIYGTKRNIPKAEQYFKIALNIADSLENFPQLKETYFQMAAFYKKNDNPKKALEFYEKYMVVNDSLYNDKILSVTTEMESIYNLEKQNSEIELLKKQQLIHELESKHQSLEIKKQRTIIILVVLGIILLVAFLISFYNRYRIKQIASKKLQIQKEHLERKNNEILDSIKYAKRIQEAILPSRSRIKKFMPEFFIFYRPRDIVSGDFYWIESFNNQQNILFAAVDCTGHGVPGAFMSLLGFNALNHAINIEKVQVPSAILNYIDAEVKSTLQQNTDVNTIKDGMDIALCNLDLNNKSVTYSGANNPLWLVSERSEIEIEINDNKKETLISSMNHEGKNLFEIKANNFAIGAITKKQESYDHKKINLQPGDTIYIFTDGYADQFGGPQNRKYMYKNMRTQILKINSKDMEEQSEALLEEFENWRGSNIQIDDLCIIGVKIS